MRDRSKVGVELAKALALDALTRDMAPSCIVRLVQQGCAPMLRGRDREMLLAAVAEANADYELVDELVDGYPFTRLRIKGVKDSAQEALLRIRGDIP